MSDLAVQPVTTSRRAHAHAWRNSVNAWLLLLPAAVLLATFTHYPIVATIQHSFFITRRSGDPLFVGFDNYHAMFEDSIFWKVLWNNF